MQGVWCGAPGAGDGIAVRALFRQRRVGGRIETWFGGDGMYTLRQVRKTTLFLYLVEQLPREREEQEENGGERVLHSKWPWQYLTQKSPHPPPSCPDLKQGERWTHKGCTLWRIAPGAQDFTHFWQKSRHTYAVPKRKTETTHVSDDGTNLAPSQNPPL